MTPELNHFVFQNSEELVNLTTKKVLPIDSPEEELRKYAFLAGQEKEAIEAALFNPEPLSISLKIIPTWECNLRCTHCFVLHELLKEDNRQIDLDSLISFVDSYLKKYQTVKKIYVAFIGGEPSLKAEFNLKTIKALRDYFPDLTLITTCTSNGVKMDETIAEFFSEMTHFVISLDGTKELHDAQRKSFDKEISPFEETLKNIRQLVSLGLRDKMHIQASLAEDAMKDEEVLKFHKILLMAGVKYENIMFGVVAPTQQKKDPEENFLNVCAKSAYVRPCCKYRLMKDFVIDSSNNVYCDYFNADKKNILGKLSDPIDKIAHSHEQIIRSSMPVLNDEKCQKCPVIGLCWGWCCNTVGLLRPSDHCDQAGLISRVKANASAGNLVKFLGDTKKNDITLSEKSNACSKCI